MEHVGLLGKKHSKKTPRKHFSDVCAPSEVSKQDAPHPELGRTLAVFSVLGQSWVSPWLGQPRGWIFTQIVCTDKTALEIRGQAMSLLHAHHPALLA